MPAKLYVQQVEKDRKEFEEAQKAYAAAKRAFDKAKAKAKKRKEEFKKGFKPLKKRLKKAKANLKKSQDRKATAVQELEKVVAALSEADAHRAEEVRVHQRLKDEMNGVDEKQRLRRRQAALKKQIEKLKSWQKLAEMTKLKQREAKLQAELQALQLSTKQAAARAAARANNGGGVMDDAISQFVSAGRRKVVKQQKAAPSSEEVGLFAELKHLTTVVSRDLQPSGLALVAGAVVDADVAIVGMEVDEQPTGVQRDANSSASFSGSGVNVGRKRKRSSKASTAREDAAVATRSDLYSQVPALYERSPLLGLKSYRLCPRLSSVWGRSVEETSLSNKLDPFVICCRFELDGWWCVCFSVLP